MAQLDILKNQQKVLEKEADTVEKSFKETVDQLDILKDQQTLIIRKRTCGCYVRGFYRRYLLAARKSASLRELRHSGTKLFWTYLAMKA